jgi:hypothetical protein
MQNDDVFKEFDRIRSYVKNGNTEPFLKNVKYFATCFREPDYPDDYRELYEKELEFNNGVIYRKDYQLLSIWRLARDNDYAKWAKSIGTEKCQLTLFGMANVTDWFYRRKGAFGDILKATERLLDVGIKPRWQLFLTTKILPDLKDLMKLISQMKLRERIKDPGDEFELFIHDVGPQGEGQKIEYLRPTIDKVDNLPAELIESTKKHLKQEILWDTEARYIESVKSNANNVRVNFSPIEHLWFLVTANWDVYTNMGSLEPWWRLGNLKNDTLDQIFRKFLNNETLAYKMITTLSTKQLADKYGDPKSKKIYGDKNDMLFLYLERYCAETIK